MHLDSWRIDWLLDFFNRYRNWVHKVVVVWVCSLEPVDVVNLDFLEQVLLVHGVLEVIEGHVTDRWQVAHCLREAV